MSVTPAYLTEQQATLTIPGTNLTIPISALTGNQMITIPGTNISIPAGGIQIPTSGIQIPTSQAISIPSSTNVQLPVASVANVANVANVTNGGMNGGDNKNGNVKEEKSPPSPAGQGWYIIYLEAFFNLSYLTVNHFVAVLIIICNTIPCLFCAWCFVLFYHCKSLVLNVHSVFRIRCLL